MHDRLCQTLQGTEQIITMKLVSLRNKAHYLENIKPLFFFKNNWCGGFFCKKLFFVFLDYLLGQCAGITYMANISQWPCRLNK